MAYWLFKTEPGTWSWDDQMNTDIEGWDGVRNHQACNNMRAMKIGDEGFFLSLRQGEADCWHRKGGEGIPSGPVRCKWQVRHGWHFSGKAFQDAGDAGGY